MRQANTAGPNGPTTPTSSIDHDAELAVRTAMAALVQSGKRAYSLSVPLAAANALVASGAGKVTLAEAHDRTQNAIHAMAQRGELEVHAEGYKDWKLLKLPFTKA